MIESKRGFILGLIKCYTREDVEETLEAVEEETNTKRVSKGIEHPTVMARFHERIPVWKKVRIRKDMIDFYQEVVDESPEYKEVDVFMLDDTAHTFKCSIEEFDKVFFE